MKEAQMEKGILRKTYLNDGAHGLYLAVYIAEAGEEAIKANIFDNWYFEQDSDHDIRKFVGEEIQYKLNTVEKKGKTFYNITHIEPAIEHWEKPDKSSKEKTKKSTGGLTKRGTSTKPDPAWDLKKKPGDVEEAIDTMITGLRALKRALLDK